jgi:hypothetical protein
VITDGTSVMYNRTTKRETLARLVNSAFDVMSSNEFFDLTLAPYLLNVLRSPATSSPSCVPQHPRVVTATPLREPELRHDRRYGQMSESAARLWQAGLRIMSAALP